MTNAVETKRRAEIMLAAKFNDDGTCTNIDSKVNGRWERSCFPIWNWGVVDYRVVAEPKVFYYDIKYDGEATDPHEDLESMEDDKWARSTGILKITVQDGKPTAGFVN